MAAGDKKRRKRRKKTKRRLRGLYTPFYADDQSATGNGYGQADSFIGLDDR